LSEYTAAIAKPVGLYCRPVEICGLIKYGDNVCHFTITPSDFKAVLSRGTTVRCGALVQKPCPYIILGSAVNGKNTIVIIIIIIMKFISVNMLAKMGKLSINTLGLQPPLPSNRHHRSSGDRLECKGKTIRSVLCNIVCNNCAQCDAHTYEQT